MQTAQLFLMKVRAPMAESRPMEELYPTAAVLFTLKPLQVTVDNF